MTDYKEDAKKTLKKATLSESWKNPKNQIVYALIVNEEIIGHIKKKIDINKLKIGDIHNTWRGRKIELIYNDEQVGGFLWN